MFEVACQRPQHYDLIMHRFFLVLSCAACLSQAHRTHLQSPCNPIQDHCALWKRGDAAQTGNPVQTLAKFLLAFAPAAAFSSSIPGMLKIPLGGSVNSLDWPGHPHLTWSSHSSPVRSTVTAQLDDDSDYSGYNEKMQQFDILSLRTFRRDTILQYDSTNQSEPLRIALTLLGILFGLCVPSLGNELKITDPTTLNVGAALSTIISGALFARNRGARQARLEKIEREYALGDLVAIYRGFQRKYLRELRGKKRIVVLFGTRAVVNSALSEAFAYRRRLVAADAIVVPIYSDEEGDGNIVQVGEAESFFFWQASKVQSWKAYFEELLSARSLSDEGRGLWVGLNLRGRTFGSALGMPRWDELLGTGMQPTGDGFGELRESEERSAEEAAEEAAKAAKGLALSAGVSAPLTPTANDHAGLLASQAKFYEALTSADVSTMQTLLTDSVEDTSLDSMVTEALGEGARIEPWEAGSSAWPPAGMRPTDRDGLILSTGEGWTTAVERPQEGGTLLATQRWLKDDDGAWRLKAHQYIPWSADGATAVLSLRCDKRGCVLFGRQINRPAP